MADQHHKKTRILLKRYLEGNCTEEEKALVEDWYLSIHHDVNEREGKKIQGNLHELQNRLFEIPKRKESFQIYARVIAAILCVTLTISLVIWNKNAAVENVSSTDISAHQDVMPGTNRATLSFDNKEQIELNEEKGGLINDDGIITYHDGTSLKKIKQIQMAMLSTPIAGQYQITLPDGSKAWLNALSSIRYPTAFIGKKRQVEITGEVYLEVAHDSKKPFVVHTNQQRIEVLGTSFNINAYADDGQTLTTLTEGYVRIYHEKFGNQIELKPGQQAVVTDNKAITIKNVDTEEISSWKDGMYIVNDEPLKHYARKIERWYDVEVNMEPYGERRLSAIIPRNAKLSEVLAAIELKTGVKFMIKERRVSAKK
ncbi:FecR family protein [Sphingobacterium arenae]|uniref:FecR domain-containing protein n=1 Tax=Sphingobacterium arenae TaxID=1280598 RepID=A0ABR7Y2F8_9SPHI|nr:FecR domain-containing protein [Sphingobacterium arenae]MBD1425492.1 FecR domain-containing protein [Sphingobacterium arenae]